MQGCLPPRYRLLDLLFALWGTVAFLADLGSDVWSAVRYYRGGYTVWASLHLGLYGLSSVILQLLSWGWFWVDRRGLPVEDEDQSTEGNEGKARHGPGAAVLETANGYSEVRKENGTQHAEEEKHGAACTASAAETAAADPPGCVDEAVYMGDPPGCVDGAVYVGDPPGCVDEAVYVGDSHTAQPCPEPCGNEEGLELQVRTPTTADTPPHKDQSSEKCNNHQNVEPGDFIETFYTSKLILWPSCLTILHFLQLGYPLRCLHSLEVGIAAYRCTEKYQDYAYFLTHDISMMRLIETFLENTPQLILVLYIIIQLETIEMFQWFSITVSFICISWAILDYHQSLRMFLKEKEKLNNLSSLVYFLWNFCLISSRVLCITLFTVTFQWKIALHFLAIWLSFFVWACLQHTEFMQNGLLEHFYRATVAVILYFSWFNIADGRTIYRCIVYHLFITIDCMLLLFSWKYLKFPSILDKYESLIIWTVMLLIATGLFIKLVYYKCVHPNIIRQIKQQYDVVDGNLEQGFRIFVPAKQPFVLNYRMFQLAQQIH